MLHKNRVFRKIAAWREAGMPMVLACVVGTEGSTYSKPGDFIVIAANGDYQGLVSGGCVEGDLAARAHDALQRRRVTNVTYDLGGEHDALWGMGAGCDGTLTIRLVPVTDDADAAALLAIRSAYEAGHHARLAIADESTHEDTGPLMIACAGGDIAPASAAQTHSLVAQALAAKAESCEVVADDSDGSWFVIDVMPAPRVLLLGAAPDAEPLCRLLETLGWSVTVYDHRPAYIAQIAAAGDFATHCGPAAELASTLTLTTFDAVVIMSHHLASDERYLAAVADCDHWHYIGVLGPRHRRERLIDSIGGIDQHIMQQLHGPAGLEIGSREPASIGLSIAAEMQQVLSSRGRL